MIKKILSTSLSHFINRILYDNISTPPSFIDPEREELVPDQWIECRGFTSETSGDGNKPASRNVPWDWKIGDCLKDHEHGEIVVSPFHPANTLKRQTSITTWLFQLFMSTNNLSGACCFASSTQPKTPWKLMFLSVDLDIPDLPQRKEVASGGRNQWFTGRTIGLCCISHQAGVDDLQVNHVFFLNLWRIEPSRFQDFFLDKSVVYLGENVHRRIAISTWFCKRRQDLDLSLQPITLL